MRVEIDQSGRLEHLDTDTVIAYANGTKGVVVIKVTIKRQIIQSLKKSVIPHDQLMPYLFAVCLYLLLSNLDKNTVLEIDEEYTGKDIIIRNALQKLFKNKWIGDIRFKRIGKKSPAHKLAWDTHRSKLLKSKVRKLKLEEILKYFMRK